MAEELKSRKQRRDQARAEREARERELAAQAARRRRLKLLAGSAAAVVVVVVALAVILGRNGGGGGNGGLKPGESARGSAEIAALFGGIPQQGITLGDPRARVTLVEFGDLKCPVCKAFADTTLPTIVRNYVRPGKVKLQFRNLAFVGEQLNPGDSPRAAAMAAAAGAQNRMWQFIDAFYRNQGDEATRYVTDTFLRQIGEATPGLDVDRAMRDRTKPFVAQQLQEAQTLATQFGISETPSFLVGNSGLPLRRVTVASLKPEDFRRVLDPLVRGG